MKKKLLFAPLFLLGLCLVSCGRPVFGFTDDYTLPYFDRNGDLFSRTGVTENEYSNVGRMSNGSEVVNKVLNASEVFLFLYQDSCSACQKFESLFTSFCLDSKIEVFFFNVGEGVADVNTLVASFEDGNYSTTFKELYTPSIFFLESTLVAENIDFTSKMSSVESFENFIKPLINLTSVYRFRTYAGFEEFASSNEGLAFFLDETNDDSLSFYDSELRGWAHHQDKNLALIEWDELSEEDKASFTARFALNGSHDQMGIYEKGGGFTSAACDYLANPEGAIKLIASIYQL